MEVESSLRWNGYGGFQQLSFLQGHSPSPKRREGIDRENKHTRNTSW